MNTANILVVAKDNQIIEKIKSCFSPLGHQIIPAYDISLGYFLAQKNFPELILCETKLKEGDAYSLLNELQSDQELAPIPFIVVDNTQGDSIDENEIKSYGAEMVLSLEETEGFIISELLPLINEQLSIKRKRQEYSPE